MDQERVGTDAVVVVMTFIAIIVFVVSALHAEDNSAVYWALMVCCVGSFVRSVMALRRDVRSVDN